MDKMLIGEARIVAIVLETTAPTVSDLLRRCAIEMENAEKEGPGDGSWTYDPM